MLLKNVRISFPNLHVPTAVKKGDKLKYNATFIMPTDHPQFEEVKQAIRDTITKKWPAGRPAALTPDRICVRDGATKLAKDNTPMNGFGPGTVFFAASNAKRPTVVDRDRTTLTENDYKPYAGCMVNATVNFWGQDNQWGKRVNAELTGVQFYADNEAFGGGSPPASSDDFPELENASDAAAAASAPQAEATGDPLGI